MTLNNNGLPPWWFTIGCVILVLILAVVGWYA